MLSAVSSSARLLQRSAQVRINIRFVLAGAEAIPHVFGAEREVSHTVESQCLHKHLQAGRRFASTANQASSSTRARFALTTGACLAAAGGFAVFGGDVAQAKDKQSKSDMKYRHVIIGAGVAARSCLKTLSAHDKTDLPGGYDGKVCTRCEHITDVPRVESGIARLGTWRYSGEAVF
jgi:nitrite reductase/ring-hydroxylating ferredoxin subunit